MTRKTAIAAGLTVTAIAFAGILVGKAERAHNLMHAGMTGRDEPIRLALSKDPDNAGLWELLGEAYANQSRYVEAIHAYDKSLALVPNDETTVWMKGIAEVCRENLEGVRSVADRLEGLNRQSGAEFRQLAKSGCCAFGKGCGNS
jgi:predicted Zn-dependent protease